MKAFIEEFFDSSHVKVPLTDEYFHTVVKECGPKAEDEGEAVEDEKMELEELQALFKVLVETLSEDIKSSAESKHKLEAAEQDAKASGPPTDKPDNVSEVKANTTKGSEDGVKVDK